MNSNNNDNNKDDEKTIEHTDNIYFKSLVDKAYELYNKSITIDCKSVEPMLWLHNQSLLRKAWEKYCIRFDKGPLRDVFMENDFALYMKYMYETFEMNVIVVKRADKLELTTYQKNKLWRRGNPELYKEQNRRKYLVRKERKRLAAEAAAAEQV